MNSTQGLDRLPWCKSSYSDDEDGDCIEVATLPATIAVRDSKDPERAHLTFPAPAFAAFIRTVTG